MNIENIHQLFLKSSGVCTDTRSITKNCIFFSLKGANFNGNKFASSALDKGALFAVIDEKEYQTEQTILVPDVLTTLQELATFHRKYLNIPIIGLTGSNGKTTTKELINSVLSTKFNTVSTKGNLNNHIGVPLTLLTMNKETELGIVEMGANHPNEIGFLCEIAKPDFGYITNFGKAHLEGFGSLEGVVKAKTELYQYLKKHQKTVFVNVLDTKQVSHATGINKFTFGNKEQDCFTKLLDSTKELNLLYNNLTIQSNLIGSYNFDNIASAIAIGQYFKVDAKNIKKAIESYIPTNNRSQILKKGTNNIILDAYNANPTSMKAALNNFITSNGSNKIVFLGDMFELGNTSEEEHQIIVTFLENKFKGNCYLIGYEFLKTKSTATFIEKFKSFEDLKNELKNKSISNSHILIKASRGMALERIVELI